MKTIPKQRVDLSGIPKEAHPFYFPNGDKAVIFVHGFSDSLCRINGFAKMLSNRGVATLGILLPGHGRTVSELAETTPDDWYAEVESSILNVAKHHKEVYVIAISFGGNLALKFDAEHPDVLNGVAIIETPMRIRKQYLTRFAIPFARFSGMKYWRKQYLKNVNHPDKDVVFKQGVFDSMPLDNIEQIIDFLESKQGFLKKVKTNLLIVQSDTSSLVARESAQEFFDRVSSKRKEIYKIENVYHAFLNDAEKKAILNKTLKFFNIEV